MADTSTQTESEKIPVELKIDTTPDNIPNLLEETKLTPEEKADLLKDFQNEKNIILNVRREELKSLRASLDSAKLSGDADTGDQYATAKERIHGLLAEFLEQHKDDVTIPLPLAPTETGKTPEEITKSAHDKLVEGLDENTKKVLEQIFQKYSETIKEEIPDLDIISQGVLQNVIFERNFGGMRNFMSAILPILKSGTEQTINYIKEKAGSISSALGSAIDSALQNKPAENEKKPEADATKQAEKEAKEAAEKSAKTEKEKKEVDSAMTFGEKFEKDGKKDINNLARFIEISGVKDAEHITQNPERLKKLLNAMDKATVDENFVSTFLVENQKKEGEFPSEKEILDLATKNNSTAKVMEMVMDPKKAIEKGSIPSWMEKILDYVKKLLGGILLSLGIDAGAKMLYPKATDKQAKAILKSKNQEKYTGFDESVESIKSAIEKTEFGKKMDMEILSGFGESTTGGLFDFLEAHQKNIPTVPVAEFMNAVTGQPKEPNTPESVATKLADKYGIDGVAGPDKDGKPGVSVSKDVIYTAVLSARAKLIEVSGKWEQKDDNDKKNNTASFADVLNNSIDWSGSQSTPRAPEAVPNPVEAKKEIPESMRENMMSALKKPEGDGKTLLDKDANSANDGLKKLIKDLRDTKKIDAQDLLKEAGIKIEEIPSIDTLSLAEASLIALSIAAHYEKTDVSQEKITEARKEVLKIKLGTPLPGEDKLTALAQEKDTIYTAARIEAIKKTLENTPNLTTTLAEMDRINLSGAEGAKKLSSGEENGKKIKDALTALGAQSIGKAEIEKLRIPDINQLTYAEAILIACAIGNKIPKDPTKQGETYYSEKEIHELRKTVLNQKLSDNVPLPRISFVEKIATADKNIFYTAEAITEIKKKIPTLAEMALQVASTGKQEDTNEKGEKVSHTLLDADATWLYDGKRPAESTIPDSIKTLSKKTYGALTLFEISQLKVALLKDQANTNNAAFKEMIKTVSDFYKENATLKDKTLREVVETLEKEKIFDK